MMKWNRIRCGRRAGAAVLAMLLLSLFLLSGCETSSAGESAATRTFVDSAGRSVAVPEEINAIAPSGSYAQMYLVSLCPEKLMGLSTALTRTQKRYLPEYLQDLTTFGQFYGGSGSVNYEAIIAAKPDIIIDIGEKKDTIVEDMDEIQSKTRIPTVFLETSLVTAPETFTTLGELTGCETRAAELAEYCRGVLDLAEKNTATLREDGKVRVYVGDGEYGTVANPAGSVHSEPLDLVGAVNVAELSDYADSGMQEVSMEQILTWDPEVIFLTTDANYEDIDKDVKWESVRAVQDQRVYEIPSAPYNWIDRPPSVQRILGILWMGNLLYPDLYAYDMTEKVQEYYQLFYGYDLSREEARELLAHSTWKEASDESSSDKS